MGAADHRHPPQVDPVAQDPSAVARALEYAKVMGVVQIANG